jgi:hypothetical protein
LKALAEAVDLEIEQTVARGRELGMTWAAVGKALGFSGQNAGKRFSERK